MGIAPQHALLEFECRHPAALPTVKTRLAMVHTFFSGSLQHFDSVGNLAAEVQNPAQTFPKAMKIVVPLVVLMYLAVVMVCVGVSPPGTVWRSSQFAEVRRASGNTPVGSNVISDSELFTGCTTYWWALVALPCGGSNGRFMHRAI